MSPSCRETAGPQVINLLGVKCPLNWARTKAVLEGLRRGETIEILVDDPRAARDIPVAAETEGYAVVGITNESRGVRIRIER